MQGNPPEWARYALPDAQGHFGPYGGVFVVVLFLEIWGTAIGLWQWHAVTPGLGLAMGNPPSGAMSGYVLFDIVALAVTARLLRGRGVPVPAPLPT